jgi:aminoglycoside phosphotransferase (APT) family kinase protein
MDWRARLAAYLAGRLPSAGEVEIVNLRGMPAGASNETVAIDLRVTTDGEVFDVEVVLRPERPDGILAPYDVQRQFRVMRALQRTAVPVPTVAWYEPDPAVLGAPFFLMSRVRGETLPLFWYADGPRLLAAAETLASIHAVDWRSAGLAFLSAVPDPATPLDAEIGAWRARAERLRISRAPLVVALAEWLRANEPADARFALLHGDPNPGNYLFSGNTVVTVLDWELAAIGDPRSDLGFYAALHTVFGGMSGAARPHAALRGLRGSYGAATGEPRLLRGIRPLSHGRGHSWLGRPLRRRRQRLQHGRYRAAARRVVRPAVGSVNTNVVPCPSSLVAQISPPCARTISREMASPSP